MDTRKVATEYRLAQWAQAVQERVAQGQNIKEFCESRGISRNTYFYWQKKLRETVCKALPGKTLAQSPATEEKSEQALVPSGWAVCEEESTHTASALTIEIGKFRIMVEPDVDPDRLGQVCRVLMTLC